MKSSSRTSAKTAATVNESSPEEAGAVVVMYLTPWCSYCRAADALLQRKGIAYRRIDVSGDRETRAWLREATGRTSVPQIFINGQPVGGFDDINALDKRGELDVLLAQTP